MNPLETLRSIRSDHSLSTTEKAVLMCMVLRADNETGQVKASQAMLAVDASAGIRTVERVLASPALRKYFEITKDGRLTIFTFSSSFNTRQIGGHSGGQIGGHSGGPSTSATGTTLSTHHDTVASLQHDTMETEHVFDSWDDDEAFRQHIKEMSERAKGLLEAM